ncbi:MAG: hypothetical protein ACYDG6_14655 [Thermincolia bacterium]
MITKLKIKLRKPDASGIFHDTKGDVKRLAIVCNELINKVNELVDKVNKLENSK